MIKKTTYTPKVFISVVSHGHSSMLEELGALKNLSEKYNVIVKNNKVDENLVDFCNNNNIYLIDSEYGSGFGYNNNVVFNYCLSFLDMSDDDFFLVVNPDIIVTTNAIEKLISEMLIKNIDAATINLYKDENLTLSDDSVRNFPKCRDFIKSFIFGVNDSKVDKGNIFTITHVDWCAGSFMAFRSSVFKKIKGFDINYFMYCEDIDICLRLSREKVKMFYFPGIKAVHKARHNNRVIFSRHFWWHIKSIILFLRAKNGLLKPKSNVVW